MTNLTTPNLSVVDYAFLNDPGVRLQQGLADEAARRRSRFNQLNLVDANSLSSLDRKLLDPTTPQIANVRQIGSGGAGVELQQSAAELSLRANQASSASEACITQYAANGRQLLGDFLQEITENTPSYEITYASGRTEIVMGGEITTNAGINTVELFFNPAYGGTIRNSRLAAPTSGRVFAAAGDGEGNLARLSFAQKSQAKQSILGLLDSGDDFSRSLVSRIRSSDDSVRVHLRFSDGLGSQLGRFREGSNVIEINSSLIARGDFSRAASVAVHEGRHFIDDVTGGLSRFSRRRAEFRAEAQELLFQKSLGGGRSLQIQQQQGFLGLGRDIERRNAFFFGE